MRALIFGDFCIFNYAFFCYVGYCDSAPIMKQKLIITYLFIIIEFSSLDQNIGQSFLTYNVFKINNYNALTIYAKNVNSNPKTLTQFQLIKRITIEKPKPKRTQPHSLHSEHQLI